MTSQFRGNGTLREFYWIVALLISLCDSFPVSAKRSDTISGKIHDISGRVLAYRSSRAASSFFIGIVVCFFRNANSFFSICSV